MIAEDQQCNPFSGKVVPSVWPLTQEGYENRRVLAPSPDVVHTSSSSPWAPAPPALRILPLRPPILSHLHCPGQARCSSGVGLDAVAAPNGPIPNPDRDANAHRSSVGFDDTATSLGITRFWLQAFTSRQVPRTTKRGQQSVPLADQHLPSASGLGVSPSPSAVQQSQQRTVGSPNSPTQPQPAMRQQFAGPADAQAPQAQQVHQMHVRGYSGSPAPFTPRKLALARSLLERPATQLQSVALEAL